MLIRRHDKLSYLWLDCPKHLTHEEVLYLSDLHHWKLLEVFLIKRLLTKAEISTNLKLYKVVKVLEGGSYDIREFKACNKVQANCNRYKSN